MLAHPLGPRHASGEVHPPAASSRGFTSTWTFSQMASMRPGQDAILALTLVGEVGHVGLEDDRAAAGERRRLLHAGGQLGGLLDGQVEPLDQLAQEVAGALRAARVLAEDLLTLPPELEDREAVAADVDQRGGGVAVEEPVRGGHGLLHRDALQLHLSSEPARHGRAADALPPPRPEDLGQARPGLLVVLDQRAPADPPAPPPSWMSSTTFSVSAPMSTPTKRSMVLPFGAGMPGHRRTCEGMRQVGRRLSSAATPTTAVASSRVATWRRQPVRVALKV